MSRHIGIDVVKMSYFVPFSSFRVQDDLKLSDAETSYPLTGMVIIPKAFIISMTKKLLLEGVCGILVKTIILGFRMLKSS
jgi:hypothetical protein